MDGIILDLYNSNRDVVRKLFFKKFLSKEQQQKYLDILSVCIEQNNMTQAERIEQIMIHHIAQVILSHSQSFNEQTTKEDVLEFIQENNFSTIEI